MIGDDIINFGNDTRQFKLMTKEYDKVKFLCKCGHRVIIPSWRDKTLCSWCNNYVFKDKKSEFEYRMKEKLKGSDKE